MKNSKHSSDHDKDIESAKRAESDRASGKRNDNEQNPPRTTTGHVTSPKFGSATIGGGEFEPGPEKD